MIPFGQIWHGEILRGFATARQYDEWMIGTVLGCVNSANAMPSRGCSSKAPNIRKLRRSPRRFRLPPPSKPSFGVTRHHEQLNPNSGIETGARPRGKPGRTQKFKASRQAARSRPARKGKCHFRRVESIARPGRQKTNPVCLCPCPKQARICRPHLTLGPRQSTQNKSCQ